MLEEDGVTENVLTYDAALDMSLIIVLKANPAVDMAPVPGTLLAV